MILIDPTVAAGFFIAAVLLAASPGPDNLFVLMQSATHGPRTGLTVTLGLCTGLIGHTAAVALGLAALLATSVWLFWALKILGAAYLLYLAWGAWHAGAAGLEAARTPALSPWQAYGRGVLMNLSNPKVALFFLAFLPQFVDPARGSVALQILQLGVLFMLATLLTFGAFALFAGWIGQGLRTSARAQRALNRTAAIVFAALAARLALISR
jgi:threonine/homoserine/homoserine lactone efflux protein